MTGIRQKLRHELEQRWVLWSAIAVLAWVCVASVLDRTKGAPSVPLDDAYIHFQFARAFSHFTPFTYTPGSEPVGGATSLLWPALLAPAFWLGIDDVQIIWVAWLLGFVSLGLVVRETRAIGRGLLSPLVGLGAALAVLCFGGLTWLAASGMEAVPFAWLWLRTFRRLADWCESESSELPIHRTAIGRELLLLSGVTPLMRPEGVAATLCVALALAVRLRGAQRLWALGPSFLALLPRIVCWLGTGSALSTTAQVKWLPYSPYLDASDVLLQVGSNLRLLYGTLFDGELWSASVIPSGGAVIAWCALPALAIQSYRSRHYARGAAVLVAALGMWIPATYDTFLWNRLRYLWPFAPAWFVAIGALCDLLGDAVQRFKPQLSGVRVLLSGVFAGALAAKVPYAIDDLAESAWAIQEQQVSLGRWARSNLPQKAVIGVNDTGAIAYFSKRRTFDVVGLTTKGEAAYWAAGPGSRFEHYERIPKASLPTHFIVYPEWFAIEPLLGEYLTDRTVNASILGGTTMVARKANYTALRSAEHPVLADVTGLKLLDRLDVADLQSEQDHDYELFDATQAQNQVFGAGNWVDGGRAGRTREQFRIELKPRGVLLVRLMAGESTTLTVEVEGQPPQLMRVEPGCVEQSVHLPPSMPAGARAVSIDTGSSRASFLHYFSFGSE